MVASTGLRPSLSGTTLSVQKLDNFGAKANSGGGGVVSVVSRLQVAAIDWGALEALALTFRAASTALLGLATAVLTDSISSSS